jgi:hypothetical protein
VLSFSRLSSRPAAPRRRSFVFRASLLLVALGGGLAFAVPACAPPPPWPLEGVARQAVARALLAIRTVDASRTGPTEELRRLAEAASAARRAAPPWRRSEWPVEERWADTLTIANRTLRELLQREREELAAWLRAAEPMRADLARARVEAREPGMGRRAGTALQRAEVLVALAERHAAQGEPVRAVEAAKQAAHFTSIVHDAWLKLHGRFKDPALRRQWSRWAEETLAESRRTGAPVIIVDKLGRRVDVFIGGQRRASFVAELGSNGLRAKQYSGDKATPEGRYRVTEVRTPGRTMYYKALMLDYPNPTDLARYRELKRQGQVPRGAGPGSLIEIHGDGGMGKDWTDGCVALTNPDMDRLFVLAGKVGVAVTIVGTYDPPGG